MEPSNDEAPKLYRLDDIMGYVELHSRFEPCTCGLFGCGKFINWSVKVDRHGNRTTMPEWVGVKTVCDGIPPKSKSWLYRLFH